MANKGKKHLTILKGRHRILLKSPKYCTLQSELQRWVKYFQTQIHKDLIHLTPHCILCFQFCDSSGWKVCKVESYRISNEVFSGEAVEETGFISYNEPDQFRFEITWGRGGTLLSFHRCPFEVEVIACIFHSAKWFSVWATLLGRAV